MSGTASPPEDAGRRILDWVDARREALVAFVEELARAESPSDVPTSQAGVQGILREALEDLGFGVRHHPGRETGGILWARPARRVRGGPAQLLLGHCDTVWPLGTLETMPVRREDGRLYGPGTFDMKAGLAEAVFALRAVGELGLEPGAVPVLLVNSDEEIGSPESARWVRLVARRVCRTLVLEPPLGPTGRLKTARKGVGRFTVRIRGRAAHAGLDPESGASAIAELGRLIGVLHGLAEPGNGVTVNVGVVQGGTRPNVVAAAARAEVDLRVLTSADGERMERAILGLGSATPGVTVEIEGGVEVPPLERTPRNRRLWEAAVAAASEMGIALEQATAGGGSDGNTTSRYTATLDGLGAVGDGAHASHEHVTVDGLVERCALVARLLLEPPDPEGASR